MAKTMAILKDQSLPASIRRGFFYVWRLSGTHHNPRQAIHKMIRVHERRECRMANFEQAAGFEHGFWLQILGDHARFIHDSLAPQEKQEIEQTRYFIQVFDQLLRSIQNADLIRLSQRADEEALQLRQLKLSIIRKQLTGKITIHLTPSFINHMVNELDEYLRVLKYLKKIKSV